jgi:fucose 4-O-acetylase-like acetyltransferase
VRGLVTSDGEDPRPALGQRHAPGVSGDGPAHPWPAPRDSWLDNAKVVAIVLVVCGHSWEPLRGDSRSLTAAYTWLYSFHMPAFVVISGYFSRNFMPTPDKVRALVSRLLLPYLFLEILYSIFRRVLDGQNAVLTFLEPWWLTWFLMTLFIWRLSSPIWRGVRHPLAISVVISCAAGLNKLPDELELSRLLQMLPFFVLGMLVQPRHLQILRRRAAGVVGAAILIAALLVARELTPPLSNRWALLNTDYATLGVGPVVGIAVHLMQFCISVVLVAAFMSVMPASRRWFTSLALGTMYAYLFHGFIVKGADYLGVFHAAILHTPAGWTAVTLLAALLAVALMTSPVRHFLQPIVEPRVPWLFPGQKRT